MSKTAIIEMAETILQAKSSVGYREATSEEIAECLYNAGYRKTFTSAFATEAQKAYKEGYSKGFEDGRRNAERWQE